MKSIIDAFSTTNEPLSDKMIKSLASSFCRDVGVRVTIKGSVSGQHLDINFVLGVLEALGLVVTSTAKASETNQEVVFLFF